MVKVIHYPAIVSPKDAVYADFDDGFSVAEIITGKDEEAGKEYNFLVYLGHEVLPRHEWHTTRPKGDQAVIVRPIVAGGDDDGGGSKSLTRALGAIAIVAASLFLGPLVGVALFGGLFAAGVATALGTALVGTAGSLLLNALAPPAGPKALTEVSGLGANSASGVGASPNYSISGARNSTQPWGVVPLIFGRNRIVPPLGAKTYTELRGSTDQWLRMLVVWGYGRLDISSIKIGDTPIANFADASVQTEVGDNIAALSTFPEQVTEQSLSVVLNQPDGFHTRNTEINTDEISIDVMFPNGLFALDPETGKKLTTSMTVAVEYRAVGAPTWTARPNIVLTAQRSETFGANDSWNVTRGSYQVRVRRVTTMPAADANVYDTVVWSALRSIRHADPIKFPKALAKSAITIRASEQLNGVIEDLNAIVTSYAPIWDADEDEWLETWSTTSNCASMFLLALVGPGQARPVPMEDINLEDIGAWHEYCRANTLRFNMIIDFEAKTWDILQMICAAGHASPAIRDGKWTVVVDEPKDVIAGHYSPHNTRNFEGEIQYQDLPHAWRCRFINETNDMYVNDERVVYREGYTKENATLFESIDFPGVTLPSQVYRLAIRHLATLILRPQTYSFETGIQNLLVTRGDRIKLVHDAPQFGLGSARIKSVVIGYPSDLLETIIVDNPLPMEAGTSYGIRIQRNDGTSQYINLITAHGYQTELQVLDTVEADDAPEGGELVLYGEALQESVDLLVRGIQPMDNFNARLICIDYSPELFDVDSNVIPAYDPNVTQPPLLADRPAAPTIRSIQSDITAATRNDDGSVVERILISVLAPAAFLPTEVILEGQAKLVGTDVWTTIFTQSRPDQVYISDVAGGEVYELRVRFRTNARAKNPGAVSPWTTQADYTVIGKTDLPPDPVQLKIEGQRAIWTLPFMPLDLAGFEMRFNKGTSVLWDQGIPVQDNLILTTDYDLAWLKGGQHTLMVKSIDTGGRYSQNFATMIIDLEDPSIGNVFKIVDYKDHDYGLDGDPDLADDIYGTVEGGSLDGTTLAADVLSGFWGAGGDDAFWQAGSSMFWEDSAVEMTYITRFIPLVVEKGIEFSLNLEIQAVSYTISYRTDGDKLLLTGNQDNQFFYGNVDGADETVTELFAGWGDWRLWPGKLVAQGRIRYFLRVVTSAGWIQGIISEFSVALDVPDIVEEFPDFSISVFGSRVPIEEEYTSIKTVLCTVQGTAGTAQYAKALDKDPDLGPLIQCYNAAGVAIAGTADIRIVGYNENG